MESPITKDFYSEKLPSYLPRNVLLEYEKDTGIQRSVSYALLPKKIEVRQEKAKINFKFEYLIKENKSKEQAILDGKVKFVLAESTKKVLVVEFNDMDLTKKVDFGLLADKLFSHLSNLEYRESVRKNYEIACKFIKYFGSRIFEPNDLANVE